MLQALGVADAGASRALGASGAAAAGAVGEPLHLRQRHTAARAGHCPGRRAAREAATRDRQEAWGASKAAAAARKAVHGALRSGRVEDAACQRGTGGGSRRFEEALWAQAARPTSRYRIAPGVRAELLWAPRRGARRTGYVLAPGAEFASVREAADADGSLWLRVGGAADAAAALRSGAAAAGARPAPSGGPVRFEDLPGAVGSRVRRGPDWEWQDQDGGGLGTVRGAADERGWVRVHWDAGADRAGAQSQHDLEYVDTGLGPQPLLPAQGWLLVRAPFEPVCLSEVAPGTPLLLAATLDEVVVERIEPAGGQAWERDQRRKTGLVTGEVAMEHSWGWRQYIIGALNQSMGVKLDGLQTRVDALQRTSEASSRDISAVQARLRAQEVRLEALEAGRSSASSVGPRAGLGSASHVSGQPDPWGAYLDQQRAGGMPPPTSRPRGGKNCKHMVFVAGFPGTWDKDEVEKHLRTELARTISLEAQGITEIYGVGRFCDQAKVVFANNQKMWGFMKRWKGQKIPCPGARNDKLWHKVDQEPHEVELSRRVSCAVRILREFGIQSGLCTEESKQRTFDGDWDRGQVVFRKNSTERPVRLLQRSRTSDMLEVSTDALAAAVLDQELKDLKLHERLSEINDPPRCAIAVANSLAPSVIGEPQFHGRTMALDLQLPIWGRVRAITSHLFSHIVRCEYAETVQQLRECLNTMPIDCHAIVSIDARDGLGMPDGDIVGPFSTSDMTWRGEMLHDLMTEFDLIAANTYSRGQWGQATCFFDNRKGPRQIDFMLIHRDWLPRTHCQARFTDASSSDHLPLLLRCHDGQGVPTIDGHTELTPMETVERPQRKPAGWQVEDPELFNSTICTSLEISYTPPETAMYTEGDMTNAMRIFTDGSARRGRDRQRRHRCHAAGWGFALYHVAEPNDQDTSLLEACGQVTTDVQDPRSVGATCLSANTGELTATIEALLWLLGHRLLVQPLARDGTRIIVSTDSTYVRNLLQGVFQPKENFELATLATHLWQRCQTAYDMIIRWVKSHNGNTGNEQADCLAKKGSDQRYSDSHWRRPYPTPDWDSAGFQDTCVAHRAACRAERKRRQADILREDAGAALGLHLTAPTATASSTRQGIASLGLLSAAICAAAAKAGHAPRRGRWRPPPGDAQLLQLQALERARAAEEDPRVRHLMGPAVCKLKRAMRDRCSTEHLARLCERGRAEKAYKTGRPARCLDKMDGGQATTSAERLQEAHTFYTQLFQDATSDRQLPDWIHQQWSAEEQQQSAPLSPPLLRTCIGCLKSCKSCDETDMIVGEMLQGLETDVLEHLLQAFRLRLRNHASEHFDAAWSGHVVQLIRKVPDARKISQFRPIALISVLQKILSMMVMETQRGSVACSSGDSREPPEAHSRVLTQLEYDVAQIKSITGSLEEHEAEYELAIRELHAGVQGPPLPSSPSSASCVLLSELRDSKMGCFDANRGDLPGFNDYADLSKSGQERRLMNARYSGMLKKMAGRPAGAGLRAPAAAGQDGAVVVCRLKEGTSGACDEDELFAYRLVDLVWPGTGPTSPEVAAGRALHHYEGVPHSRRELVLRLGSEEAARKEWGNDVADCSAFASCVRGHFLHARCFQGCLVSGKGCPACGEPPLVPAVAREVQDDEACCQGARQDPEAEAVRLAQEAGGVAAAGAEGLSDVTELQGGLGGVSPRMCPLCFAGPLYNPECADLQAHHGQCPRCRARPFTAAQIAEAVAQRGLEKRGRAHPQVPGLQRARAVQRLRGLRPPVPQRLEQPAAVGPEGQGGAGHQRALPAQRAAAGGAGSGPGRPPRPRAGRAGRGARRCRRGGAGRGSGAGLPRGAAGASA
ncbi:unnamed protein product [Prorocentrum cordatum]|uniref:RNase H type-1 domain-containing protein n=1 Tax=Prorocentrum cordatum TaxID=2364126 RepID=A0ABN9YF58_9DINO|nr:unnamed protein product [Polarella glacialis]